MIKIENLNINYGVINAIRDISIQVKKGEIVTLVGANGAGKTSTLRAISGLVSVKSGDIKYKDQSIVGIGAHKIVAKGISHVPEGRRIFSDMTVLENLMIGTQIRRDKKNFAKDLEEIYDMFPRLKERYKQIGGTLSGGEQQMLAIGRALMARPEVLLLDEPSMGLAPIFVDQIFETILKINEQGTTIVLVEQNANAALSIADRGYVIETGEIVLGGDAKELKSNELVKKAYLGG